MGVPIERAVVNLNAMAKGIKAPMVRALNRTADHIKVVAAREVAKKYTIKQSDTKAHMKVNKASQSNLNAVIKAESRLLTPYHFKFTPKAPAVQKGIAVSKRKKVTVNIIKSRKVTMRHAFVATIKGTTNIYMRQGKSLKSMRSVSVPQMIQSDGVEQIVNKEMQEYYEKQHQHEMEFAAKKAGFK